MLFLGNYSGRDGKDCLEVLCLLMALKVKYPDSIHLLRGSNETDVIAHEFGLRSECLNRYSEDLFSHILNFYDCLPFAALVQDGLLCMHSGVSPQLEHLSMLAEVSRPRKVDIQGPVKDLFWSTFDPESKGWVAKEKGYGYTFGPDVIMSFLETHGFRAFIRSHQAHESGKHMFESGRILTIWSASNFMGQKNQGTVIVLGEDCQFSFKSYNVNTA